ncbi:nucleotide exchange factor GrpE [Brevibacterium sp. 5221]|uniref:Protein GrpE n=1 Tax=Brevibacterium rongguiense TaxID=2695267 RepID=A0A6N9HAQ7_9MICO|nr:MULTISPECIES: nucleotide exchange factor GrpE [Brevibacterium]MYM20584.1 nucleotide exchange factor GrpE [Brevibacterium rongguiense]WAL39283.1 nucleotide exchange factor GrpE [Brevibacterium sp. BRM-1]
MTAENPENGPQSDQGNQEDQAAQGFSFSDKRRVDPDSGAVREPHEAEAGAGAGPAGASAAEGAADAADLGVDIPDDASALDPENAPAPQSEEAAKYLDDLQRLNAEYAAYRRRSAREQDKARAAGAASFAEAIIPVLDEVKLAADNGDVTGPFESHVAKLRAALEKAGFVQYGEVGEEFDPNIHEALMQQPSDEVGEPTVFAVMQPGYRLGDRVLRAARVGVSQPAE